MVDVDLISLISFALAGSWMILGSSGMFGCPDLASLVRCVLLVELDLDALIDCQNQCSDVPLPIRRCMYRCLNGIYDIV